MEKWRRPGGCSKKSPCGRLGIRGRRLRLGQQYDADKLYDLARARYELVLRAQPANVVALNNLAYNLGVYGESRRPGWSTPSVQRRWSGIPQPSWIR